MPTLEEILKQRGYSDADIQQLAPSLQDPKFRGALESQFSELMTERDGYKQDVSDWSKWHQDTALPTLEKSQQAQRDAAARAAAAEARLTTLQEQGLIKLAEQSGEKVVDPKPVSDFNATFDPKKHNLVTMDDVRQFAEGMATQGAVFANMGREHRELFGADIDDYEALLAESRQSKKHIRDHWQAKYNVDAKRKEVAEKKQKEHDDKLRAEGRQAAIAEFGNPMTRPPVSSRNPFTLKTDANAKQPWENAEDRANARVERAAKSMVQ